VVPPTMRPSSLGFSGSRGTPEVLTNIFITNSTVYIMSIHIWRPWYVFTVLCFLCIFIFFAVF
jgi:hypothetical protein